MSFHGRVGVDDGVHAPFAWVFADAAARLAFLPTLGIPAVVGGLVAADVHRVALQLSDNTQWRLATLGPTWAQLGGGGGSSLPFHGPTVVEADSIYNAALNETVKVLTLFGDAGDITVQLPPAAGNAGETIKVISVTPPFTGALPGGHVVIVLPAFGETINGSASVTLTNAGENVNLESDGTDWLITG